MGDLTEAGTIVMAQAQAQTPAAPTPMTAPGADAPPQAPGADVPPRMPGADAPPETGGAPEGASAGGDAAPAGGEAGAGPGVPTPDGGVDAPAAGAVQPAPDGAIPAAGPDAPGAVAPDLPPLELTGLAQVDGALDSAREFLVMGGPAIWAIGALSVITVALILWKIWRLALMGAWSKGKARHALTAFEAGRPDAALQIVERRRGLRSRVLTGALRAWASLPEAAAREETARVAQQELASLRGGLRALELIASIAPLLGLLGTVLGMIAAFQTLQEAGSRADPAMLAGGIWEALLTTAAGMAVAIPASAALTWFESVIERIRLDVEDAATRIFVAPQRVQPAQAMAAE